MMNVMHNIFQHILGLTLFIHLDDIVIFSMTLEEHQEIIREVCHRLQKAKLYANRTKTSFLPDSIKVLGHVLIKDRIVAAPEKLLKVKNWETPKIQKELQGFMGMVNYFSNYVPHLSTFTAPLTNLYGSTVPWKWRDIHSTSFKRIKDILAAEAILTPLNYKSKDMIYLVTDARAFGIGA